MHNPFRYRPADPEIDDWADNAVSNVMAWLSQRLLPGWCATPEHWTSRLTMMLWTDCPCCLLWRGLVLGFLAGLGLGLLI